MGQLFGVTPRQLDSRGSASESVPAMNSGRPPGAESLRVQGARVAVVLSRYNDEVGEKLLAGALTEIDRHALAYEVFRVPGAFEIPLLAQRLAQTKRFDGVVAIGVVIKGDTAHFEHVCNAVTSGLTRVGLDSGLPIGFGVITTDNLQQALDRAGGKAGNKGSEAALAVLEMVSHLRQIK